MNKNMFLALLTCVIMVPVVFASEMPVKFTKGIHTTVIDGKPDLSYYIYGPDGQDSQLDRVIIVDAESGNKIEPLKTLKYISRIRSRLVYKKTYDPLGSVNEI